MARFTENPLDSTFRPANDWQLGPEAPVFSDDQVHVWWVELGVARDLGTFLSADEHARAARIARPQARERWARSRVALRIVLARYVGVQPHALRIAAEPLGKPCLQAGGPSFNLSHSGDVELIAVRDRGRVGIDVELFERAGPRDPVSVARRAFGADAATRLEALPPPTAQRELLCLWVRREAHQKCLGAVAPAQLEDKPLIQELALGAHAVAALATLPAATGEPRLWRLADDRPPSD
ncbi:MAG TPA: 4'-phosphopantetheinyl transferase superfamily protein [Solirubrobacteraceae bacterium]